MNEFYKDWSHPEVKGSLEGVLQRLKVLVLRKTFGRTSVYVWVGGVGGRGWYLHGIIKGKVFGGSSLYKVVGIGGGGGGGGGDCCPPAAGREGGSDCNVVWLCRRYQLHAVWN